MQWRDYLEANPAILFGKFVIKNTRIPVDLILEKLANGSTIDNLLQAYPRMTKEAIQASLLFASDNAKHEKVLAIA